MAIAAPDVVERLLFHAERVEECGHINAGRYMRLAAEELEYLRGELTQNGTADGAEIK